MVRSDLEHDTRTPDVETSSDAYRERFAGDVGRFLLRAQADAVEHLLGEPDQRPLRVLDLGGGHGQLTRLLLDRGYELCVHGSAPSCIRQIRPLLDTYRGRLQFVTSTLWSLPFADGSFDLVCALRVISHVEAWRAFLAEMARVTRRWVIFDYAALASFNLFTPILFGVKRRIESDTRPYFCYRTGRLARELEALGFGRIRVRRQLLVPMAVHRLLGSGRLSESVERLSRAIGATYLLGSPAVLLAEKAIVREPAQAPGPAGPECER
jgi:SAM-dependent methyltransferase